MTAECDLFIISVFIFLELSVGFVKPHYIVFENESSLLVQLECSELPYRGFPVTVELIAFNVTSTEL